MCMDCGPVSYGRMIKMGDDGLCAHCLIYLRIEGGIRLFIYLNE